MTFPEEHRDFAAFATQGVRLKAFNLPSERAKERYWKAFERQRSGFYGYATGRVQRALDAQWDEVVRAILGSPTLSRIPRDVARAVRRSEEELAEAVEEVYARVVPVFYGLVLAGLKSRKQDEDDLTPQQRIEARQAAEEFVAAEGGTLISAPNEFTQRVLREAAQAAVDEGLRLGWGIERIAREIEERSGGAIGRARARRIARTETIRASNFGSLEAALSTELDMLKEWIATDDDRTRETHRAADFQQVPVNEMFTVGGYPCRFPADTTLPASESVNCRCTLAYVTI